jgi:predicted hydrocarbon binding protein
MNPPNRDIDARLPLALLQAVQQQDTPPELMPDEHPHSFFPHRLGLSGVVEDQIRQFRRLARQRRRVAETEVVALLELIARRSDAGAVFTAAGRELAGQFFSGPTGLLRRIARRLPLRLRERAAHRTLRTAHGTYLIAAEKAVEIKPLEIRATDALTARVGDYSAACKLYGSLAASLLELSGLGRTTVAHTQCQRRGDAACVWRVEGDGGQ